MNTPAAPDSSAILAALATVQDPEFSIGIVDLGLIYDVAVTAGEVVVTMTLTSFYCPAGDVITAGVKSAAERVPSVRSARVELVWEPLWTPERLSPAARAQLGWDTPHLSA